VLLLNSSEVRRALPIEQAIEAMKEAFAALSSGRALVPHRAHLSIPKHSGISLVMASYVEGAELPDEALAVKVVSLFDGNLGRGLARIQAVVVMIEPDTGRVAALLDGATLTSIRTAAASGAATDLLARRGAKTLALFGAGVQARAHLEAICAIRPIETVRVYGQTPTKVEALCRDFSNRVHCLPAKSPSDALNDADIVCATTTSRAPIFDDVDLELGVHINAVGSFTPGAAEVPGETVVRAKVVVDSREAAWLEAGDLIQPLQAGKISREHIHAELGEIVTGAKPGRVNEQEVTFFKSVGIAVQDAIAARVAVANARKLGIGSEIEW